MFLRRAVLYAALVAGAGAGQATLFAADQPRVDRAIEVANRRLDEWLGAAVTSPVRLPVREAWWSAPSSMELESQLAFELARARFSRLRGARALVDGIAWHLQSRIVEELFDYSQGQPGHHAAAVPLFGAHVRWGVPILILPRHARDDRAPLAVSHAAEAVATLEGLVGWPALAAALRVVASDPHPALDHASVRVLLESALAVPLDWFFEAIEPDFTVNYALDAVAIDRGECGGEPCYRSTLRLRREGGRRLPAGVEILIETGGRQASTLRWAGTTLEQSLVVESAASPLAVTLDPDRRIRVDPNPLDQRWRGSEDRNVPVKSFAAWLVWLQNAVLSYGVLL